MGGGISKNAKSKVVSPPRATEAQKSIVDAEKEQIAAKRRRQIDKIERKVLGGFLPAT